MPSNLSKFVGQFTADTTLSSPFIQSITAPGFQPKVVIFWTTGATATDSTQAAGGIGFTDGTNHRYIGWEGLGAAGNTTANTIQSDLKAIIFSTLNPVTSGQATVSMTATGFDVDWLLQPSEAAIINYIALAGTDLANVAIGNDTMPLTAIAKSVTGLSFQPNFVMLISGSSALTGTNVGFGDSHFSYGCAISSSARFAHALTVATGATMSASVNGVSVHSTDAVLQGIAAATAALEYKADFTSFNSDGFTITFSSAPASNAYQFYYLAIGGANLNWDIGTAAKPTTAIAQSDATVAFQPEIAWWSNSDLPTLNTITSNAVQLLGASDGTTTQSVYTSHNDAVNTVCGIKASTAAAQDGAPANSSVVASFTSFNSNGWTITWGGVGAANQISTVSLAGTTASGPTVGEMMASTQYGQIQPFSLRTQIVDY